LPAASDSTTLKGTNRAPFQRTLDDGGGGHRFRGGTTSKVSPWYGKHELNRTAGSDARAVASNHVSNKSKRDMAEVTAEYKESL
jgi:hypothetical protein